MGLHPAERVREYRAKGYWNDDMIDALLRERVRVHGDIPALVDPLNRDALMDGPFRSLTWPQLDEEVSRLAQVLLDEGLRAGDVVRFARRRPHPGELLAAIPAELVGQVSLVGDEQTVRARLAEYASAGVDEVALVPGSSEADPAGLATLTALAP